MNTLTWTDWSCTVHVTATDRESAEAARAVVHAVMREVASSVSRFRSDSDLSLINAHAGSYVPVKLLTIKLLHVAIRAARDTGGAVDPALGADLISLGYDDDIDTVRNRPTRRRSTHGAMSRRAAAWRDIHIDYSLGCVGIPTGVQLDLGATAKAWAVDEATRRLQAAHITPVLVSIGGDLAAAGAPRKGWQVDVCELEGGPTERITLHVGGLATSSAQGRRWTSSDGSTAHHVLDPRTGRPADVRWRTASVAAPTCLDANIASTWLLVDPDAAEFALARQGHAARLVAGNGTIATAGAWPDQLRPELVVAS